MARTKQTARKSAGGKAPRKKGNVEDYVEETPSSESRSYEQVLEEYALSRSRGEALEKLVPGSKDCLLFSTIDSINNLQALLEEDDISSEGVEEHICSIDDGIRALKKLKDSSIANSLAGMEMRLHFLSFDAYERLAEKNGEQLPSECEASIKAIASELRIKKETFSSPPSGTTAESVAATNGSDAATSEGSSLKKVIGRTDPEEVLKTLLQEADEAVAKCAKKEEDEKRLWEMEVSAVDALVAVLSYFGIDMLLKKLLDTEFGTLCSERTQHALEQSLLVRSRTPVSHKAIVPMVFRHIFTLIDDGEKKLCLNTCPFVRYLVKEQLDELAVLCPAVVDEYLFLQHYESKATPSHSEIALWIKENDPHNACEFSANYSNWKNVEQYLTMLQLYPLCKKKEGGCETTQSTKERLLVALLKAEKSLGISSLEHFATYLQFTAEKTQKRPWVIQSGPSYGGYGYGNAAHRPTASKADESLVTSLLVEFLLNPTTEILAGASPSSSQTLTPGNPDDDEHLSPPDATSAAIAYFSPYFRQAFLETQLAEAMLTRRPGVDTEHWCSVLNRTNGKLTRLTELQELSFPDDNRKYFPAESDVSVDVCTKNVERLVVQVFELDSYAYYKREGEEISAAVNLDGIVANWETVIDVESDPLVRCRTTIPLPSLSGPRFGAFVVEVVGGAKACRALLKKGSLNHIEECSPRGHLFRVFDDSANEMTDCASVTVGEVTYGYSAELKAILVPYFDALLTDDEPGETAAIRTASIILTAQPRNSNENIVALSKFTHRERDFSLVSGMFTLTEDLVPGRRAKLLIRPRLYVCEAPCDLSLLHEVILSMDVEFSDVDIPPLHKETTIAGLSEAEEYVHEFDVEPGMETVTFTLTGDVATQTLDGKQGRFISARAARFSEVRDSLTVSCCSTGEASPIHNYMLKRRSSGFVLQVVGKSGEAPPKPEKVDMTFTSKIRRHKVSMSLWTDHCGEIALGSLLGVSAVGIGELSWKTSLLSHSTTYCSTAVTLRSSNSAGMQSAGSANKRFFVSPRDVLHIPHALTEIERDHSEDCVRRHFSLFLVANSQTVRDMSHVLSVGEKGNLTVTLNDTGSYTLIRLHDYEKWDIKVAERTLPCDESLVYRSGLICKRSRTNFLSIAKCSFSDDDLMVEICDADDTEARVHLMGRYFRPRSTAELSGKILRPPESQSSPSPNAAVAFASYLGTKVVSEEYQYIIHRKTAAAQGALFPGNFSEKPSLLLRSYNSSKVSSKSREAKEGGAYASRRAGTAAVRGGASLFAPAGHGLELETGGTCSFLPSSTSFVKANLRPERTADGRLVLRVPAAELADAMEIEVCVATAKDVVMASILREGGHGDEKVAFNNIALLESQAFKSTSRLAQHGSVHTLAAGERFKLSPTAQAQSYSTLADVFTLLDVATDGNVLYNVYVKDWHAKTDDRKLELYSTAPSTEMNLFLYFKDREFFDRYIKEYLSNKKTLLFADRWLLDMPLDKYCALQEFLGLSISERLLLAVKCQEHCDAITAHVLDLPAIREGTKKRKHLFQMALSGGVTATSMIEYRGNAQGAKMAMQQQIMGMGNIGGMNNANFMPPQMQQMQQQQHMALQMPMPMMQERMGTGASNREHSELIMMDECMESAEEDYNVENNTGQQVVQQVAVTGKRSRDSASHAKKRKTGATGSYTPVGPTYSQKEMNYHNGLVNTRQVSVGSMTASRFHHDLAHHVRNAKEKGCVTDVELLSGFLSSNVTDMSSCFADCMFALATIDLPFTSENTPLPRGEKATITAKSPMVLFVQDVGEALAPSEEQSKEIGEIRQNLVVKQLLYDPNLRDNKGAAVKQWPAVFECGKVYSSAVTLINTKGAALPPLSLLEQVPVGAVPLTNGLAYHRVQDVILHAHGSRTITTSFYFRFPGTYSVFPANVSKDGMFVASSLEGSSMVTEVDVVKEVTQVDKTSWVDVSKRGTDEDILAFLNDNNVNDLTVEEVVPRLGKKEMFLKVTDLLRKKLLFSTPVWALSFFHRDSRTMQEYLSSTTAIATLVGPNLKTSLLTTTQEVASPYQEYYPLLHPRAHAFDAKRQLESRLTNSAFRQSYLRFLEAISYRKEVNCEDLLVATYYLLLQERVGLAVETFTRCKELGLDDVRWRLQADYLAAYLDLYTGHETSYEIAANLTAKYSSYPIVHWRERFESIRKHLEEYRALVNCESESGHDSAMDVDGEDRSAEMEPILDILKVCEDSVTLQVRNVTSLVLNYFVMDVEAAFSCEPFAELTSSSSRFSVVKPTHTQTLDLGMHLSNPEAATMTVNIDESFKGAQCMIEAVATVAPSEPPLRCLKPHFTAQLSTKLTPSQGCLRIFEKKSLRPLHGIYVKAFALFSNGNVRFYKDGYTDLRGYFDYVGLNQNLLADIEEFSLLVHSHSHGSVILKVSPPVAVSTAEDGRQVRSNW